MTARHLGTAMLLMGVALGGVGCGAATEQVAAQPAPPYGSSTALVENYNWSDIVIYTVTDAGMKIRLGMVPSMQKRTFAIPPGLAVSGATLRLLADPIGSNRVYRSPEVSVVPGSEVRWQLENYLPHSSISVW